MNYDVIIIGAGASGVMALNKLSNAGYTCCLFEASPKAGGRIESITDGFTQVAETGAEFIHGELSLTLSILKEARIPIEPVSGRMVPIYDGAPKKNTNNYVEMFLAKAATLTTDITLQTFFDYYFPGDEFFQFRENISRFANGFDLADADKASVLSLKEEWSHEDEPQYRIQGGYVRLIDYLLATCRTENIALHFNSVVTRVATNKDSVTVNTSVGREFSAKIAVVTVSMGVLKAQSIQFNPLPAEYKQAIQQSGFGKVIKFLLEFNSAFWEKKYMNAGFFITNEIIPTWWTQYPQRSNLLTGWLGGPSAETKSGLAENELLDEALNSLSQIFKIEKQTLKQELLYYKIINWQSNIHTCGGYSYPTIDSVKMKEHLATPLAGRLFFAGEAVWNGESQGTVEAALQSGLQTTEKILSSLV